MATLQPIDHSLVTVGKPKEGGCVYAAPYGTVEMPTDATTDMSTLSGWESVGDLSSDGFTESNSKSNTDHKNWDNKTVLSTTNDESNTFKLNFIEINRPVVAKLRYGSNNVEVGDDGSVSHISGKVGVDEEWSLVIDELESNGFLRRSCIERAKADSFDDISHNSQNLIAYGITFKNLAGTVNDFDVYRAKPATGSTGSTGATGQGLEEA